MSLLNPTDFPIVAATTSGNQLADILNRLFNAYESNQRNATRPPQLTAGGLWTKLDGATLRLMMYDGAVDIEIGSITGGVGAFGATPTPLSNVFNPASTYKAGDVVYDPTSKGYLIAKTDLVAGAFKAGDWTQLADPFSGIKDAVLALVDAKIAKAVADYLPLAGGTLTGPLISSSTIATDGAITSKADITAFKP